MHGLLEPYVSCISERAFTSSSILYLQLRIFYVYTTRSEIHYLTISIMFNYPEYHLGKKDVVVNIVDFIAKKNPQALYAEFPVSPTS